MRLEFFERGKEVSGQHRNDVAGQVEHPVALWFEPKKAGFGLGALCLVGVPVEAREHIHAQVAMSSLIAPASGVSGRQRLPVALFDALIIQESRYQHVARSPKGAIGLAQLMPGTARQLGVDAYTLADNLRGGARYLKEQYSRFGRYDLALAAYNAGPGRAQERWAIPRIAETEGYVRKIMGNWTGTAPATAVSPKPISSRQAQLVFMPARTLSD